MSVGATGGDDGHQASASRSTSGTFSPRDADSAPARPPPGEDIGNDEGDGDGGDDAAELIEARASSNAAWSSPCVWCYHSRSRRHEVPQDATKEGVACGYPWELTSRSGALRAAATPPSPRRGRPPPPPPGREMARSRSRASSVVNLPAPPDGRGECAGARLDVRHHDQSRLRLEPRLRRSRRR